MNVEPIDPKRHPETWIEDQVARGGEHLQACHEQLKAEAADRPLRTLAAAFGAGYVARSLPLFRIAGVAVRGSLHLLPYALLIVGGARAYEFIRTQRVASQTAAGAEPMVAPSEPAS